MFRALLLVLIGSLASTAHAANAKWTIMVFMNGDNNLEPFAIQDFAEMASLGSNPDVKLVVQFDRSPHWSSAHGDWKQTLRFLVKKDMKPTVANAVSDVGELNMGDGAVLSDFVEWSRQQYPADNYALIIWNHGQGWRFNQATRLLVGNAPKKKSLLKFQIDYRKKTASKKNAPLTDFNEAANTIPADYVVSGAVRYVSSDDTSADHLFNREMQDSLTSDIGIHQIDLIGFDACLMAMIETGYAMRDVADVLVASQELEPGDGWNYELWIAPLITNPNLTAEQLGTELVKAFKSHYDPINSETTLSAVRLSQMAPLSAAVNSLADACMASLTTENGRIRAARDSCSVYAPGYGLHGIDLKRFAEQVQAQSTDADIQATAASVSQALTASVISAYAGPDRQGTYGSAGLAIYFPGRKFLYDLDPDGQGYRQSNTVYPVQFVQDHRWDEFLHSYFVLNP